MRRSLTLQTAALTLLLSAGAAFTQANIASLRDADLAENGEPPAMRPQVDQDIRQVRNYPEQPPVIPHAIDGYQVDMNANKCMTCHARTRVGESQAPMVSVTHFMDRDGQALASVSPRRYFCNQCHVPQHPDNPRVKNNFVDIDTLLSLEAGQPSGNED